MEKRDLKISFYKAGNGVSTRLNVPIVWLRKMDITENDREVELIFDEKKQHLLIKKKK